MSNYYKMNDNKKGIPEDVFNKLNVLDYSNPDNVKGVFMEVLSLLFQSMDIYRTENEVIRNYIKDLDKLITDIKPMNDQNWWNELKETHNLYIKKLTSKE